MVLGGLSLLHIQRHHSLYPSQRSFQALCLAHHTDAPVDIGRVTVTRVVRYLAGDIAACVKGLVAHQHSFAERPPREAVGRREPSVVEEMPLAVHHIGVAIEHSRSCAIIAEGGSHHLLYGVGSGQQVASVEKAHVVARGEPQSLVHGVVEPIVGLRLSHHHMTAAVLLRLPPIVVHQPHGVIGRRPIDDDMLDGLKLLGEHAVEGWLEHLSGVIGDGDDRDGDHMP